MKNSTLADWCRVAESFIKCQNSPSALIQWILRSIQNESSLNNKILLWDSLYRCLIQLDDMDRRHYIDAFFANCDFIDLYQVMFDWCNNIPKYKDSNFVNMKSSIGFLLSSVNGQQKLSKDAVRFCNLITRFMDDPNLPLDIIDVIMDNFSSFLKKFGGDVPMLFINTVFGALLRRATIIDSNTDLARKSWLVSVLAEGLFGAQQSLTQWESNTVEFGDQPKAETFWSQLEKHPMGAVSLMGPIFSAACVYRGRPLVSPKCFAFFVSLSTYILGDISEGKSITSFSSFSTKLTHLQRLKTLYNLFKILTNVCRSSEVICSLDSVVNSTTFLNWIQRLFRHLVMLNEKCDVTILANHKIIVEIVIEGATLDPQVIDPSVLGPLAVKAINVDWQIQNSHLFSKLTHIYTRLHQVPKLMAKLLISLSTKEKMDIPTSNFPSLRILASFNDCISQYMSLGQVLELWKTFLFHLEGCSSELVFIVLDSLVAEFLKHICVVSQSISKSASEKIDKMLALTAVHINTSVPSDKWLQVHRVLSELVRLRHAFGVNVKQQEEEEFSLKVQKMGTTTMTSLIDHISEDDASIHLSLFTTCMRSFVRKNKNFPFRFEIDEKDGIIKIIDKSLLMKCSNQILLNDIDVTFKDVAQLINCLEMLPLEHMQINLQTLVTMTIIVILRGRGSNEAKVLLWNMLARCLDGPDQRPNQILQFINSGDLLLYLGDMAFEGASKCFVIKKLCCASVRFLQSLKSLSRSNALTDTLPVSPYRLFTVITVFQSLEQPLNFRNLNPEKRLICLDLAVKFFQMFILVDKSRPIEVDDKLMIKGLTTCIVLRPHIATTSGYLLFESDFNKIVQRLAFVSLDLLYGKEKVFDVKDDFLDLLVVLCSNCIHFKHCGVFGDDFEKFISRIWHYFVGKEFGQLSNNEKQFWSSLYLINDECVFKNLVNNLYKVSIIELKDNSSRCKVLDMWQCLVSLPLSSEISQEVRRQELERIMPRLNSLITFKATYPSDNDYSVLISLLRLVASILEADKPLLSNRGEAQCLLASVRVDLHRCIEDDRFLAIWRSIYSVLYVTITKRSVSLFRPRIPIILDIFRRLICSLVSSNLGSEESIFCLHLIERMAKEISCNHRDDVARLAPFVISDILHTMQKNKLLYEFKNNLLCVLNEMFHICDKHSLTYLTSNLPPDVVEIYKEFLSNYERNHKYMGNI